MERRWNHLKKVINLTLLLCRLQLLRYLAEIFIILRISDEIPTKRKFQQPSDQYAVDAHGRRRFHGAFTGGFSAGFGNTVGTQEGWTPATFKSSRSDKAQLSVSIYILN